MRAFVLLIALSSTLAGCRYLPHDTNQSCDKHMDWNDRKACKERIATESKEWEKREGK